MAKYKVTGGTHLGIVSCYGIKEFEVENQPALPMKLVAALQKDQDIPSDAKFDWYHTGSRQVFCFVDKEGNTIFEFYYEQVKENEYDSKCSNAVDRQ